jgi:DNA-directed RNA polymerase subunit K/omega
MHKNSKREKQGAEKAPRVEKYTKYERARIIGSRALQISMGAPILIPRPKGLYNPIEIAKLELEKRVLPITIRRIMPARREVIA